MQHVVRVLGIVAGERIGPERAKDTLADYVPQLGGSQAAVQRSGGDQLHVVDTCVGRLSAAELAERARRACVRTVWPDALACHDAEDACLVVRRPHRAAVRSWSSNRRAVGRSLLVYVKPTWCWTRM